MRVAAVDIGTNSMRLLVTDGAREWGRWERITGLGRGVDKSGILSGETVEATLEALGEYRSIIDGLGVSRTRAIATSASRDAANREEFFDSVEGVLGVRPELIPGEVEALLAYSGATAGFDGAGPVLVSDIGGGSTEFVTADQGVSVDIGSVRLTERVLPSRPSPESELEAARAMVRDLFSGVGLGPVGTLIGVAGTWTELPNMSAGLPHATDTHGKIVTREGVAEVIDLLSGLTVEETAALGTVNPARAPAILGGVLIAEGVMEALGVGEAVASVHDTLDGVAAGLLADGGLP